MKKFLIGLMVFGMMMNSALATGRVIPSQETQPAATEVQAELPKLELSGCMGMSPEEYAAFKEANPEYENFPMSSACEAVNGAGETVKIINELTDRSMEDGDQSDFSIIGFFIGQKIMQLDELMAANGWEQISKWYEGGTLDFTFKKAEGGATYTLRLWSNLDRDGEIRLINLKVDDVAAHIANAEAGINLMPVAIAEE